MNSSSSITPNSQFFADAPKYVESDSISSKRNKFNFDSDKNQIMNNSSSSSMPNTFTPQHLNAIIKASVNIDTPNSKNYH